MRYSKLIRPFTGGMVTDAPAHTLDPSLSTYAQDGFTPQGVFTQRQGWEYDGSTADAAVNLRSVARAKFVLSAVTRTLTTTGSLIYVHNPSGVGTPVGDPAAGTILFRCVYDDQLIGCYQDGITPMVLYSGAAFEVDDVTTAGSVANTATITASVGTWAAVSTKGAYKLLSVNSAADYSPGVWPRILERNSTTSLTIDGIKFSTTATNSGDTRGTGLTYPCVNVYDAGTGSFNTAFDVFTGVGTKWSTFGVRWSTYDDDALLGIKETKVGTVHRIFEVASDTELNLGDVSQSDTNIKYAILRRCPFKDAATHKGSLWGTGVAQYKSRVYVGPPGWNLAFPPGFTPPYDPDILPTSTNPNKFLMDFIDVPSSNDSDDIIAILTSPNPLLVLKRSSVYGVYGSFPNYSVDMIADGIGCIDIRSAQSFDEGQFWAGESGIYWYSGGRVTDLTDGRINREWRNLTRDFDYGTSDYCSIGLSQGHLIVHITTAGGTIQRTYLCDLRGRTWQSRISNFTPRYMFASRVSGESEKLLAVSDARQGRVIDFTPALDRSGTSKDDAGSAPRLVAYTPEGIDGGDTDADTRFVDLSIHANAYDAGAAGATSMAVSVVSQDALTSGATGTKALADIDSDTIDTIDRHYFRTVNRSGRRHQVRIEVDTLGTDTNGTKVEIHQIDASFRASRTRT